MPLTPDDVLRIAHLARIEIDAADVQDVHPKLESIFGLLAELAAVDTRGVTPLAHPQECVAPLREDAVTEPDQHALFQAQAPAVEDGLYLVPRVVE